VVHKSHNSRGGGVGILSKPNIDIETKHDTVKFVTFQITETVLHIAKTHKLLIACIFRSCSQKQTLKSSINTFFAEFEDYLLSINKSSYAIPSSAEISIFICNVQKMTPFISKIYAYFMVFNNI